MSDLTDERLADDPSAERLTDRITTHLERIGLSWDHVDRDDLYDAIDQILEWAEGAEAARKSDAASAARQIATLRAHAEAAEARLAEAVAVLREIDHERQHTGNATADIDRWERALDAIAPVLKAYDDATKKEPGDG